MGCSTFNGGHSEEIPPTAEFHKEICLALKFAKKLLPNKLMFADLTIVFSFVGDPKSNNSNRLAQVSQEIAGTKAYRVADVSEIKLRMATRCRERSCYSRRFFYSNTNYKRGFIAFLEQYDPMNPATTWERVRKVPLQKSLPRVKVKKEQ